MTTPVDKTATAMDVDSGPVADNASPSPAAPDATTKDGGGRNGDGDEYAASHRQKRLRPVSPRTLEEMTNSFELVSTVLGAIEAHRRLYEDAGYLHGDINPNTIIILDWPAAPSADTAGGGGDAKKKKSGARSEGALVDFDIPYSIEAVRKLGERWPPKRVNHSQFYKLPVPNIRGYWMGYGNGYVY